MLPDLEEKNNALQIIFIFDNSKSQATFAVQNEKTLLLPKNIHLNRATPDLYSIFFPGRPFSFKTSVDLKLKSRLTM